MSKIRTVGALGAAVAVASGALVAGAGGRLGAASLDAIVERFPDSRVRLDRLAGALGEADVGAPWTRTALGAGEGVLFGAGLAAGLTRRPRSRASD